MARIILENNVTYLVDEDFDRLFNRIEFCSTDSRLMIITEVDHCYGISREVLINITKIISIEK